MPSVISTYNKQQNLSYFIGFSYCSCGFVIIYKSCVLPSMDTSSRWPDQIIWQRYVPSLPNTKRCTNEAGFEVSTYIVILDDLRVSQCKLRQVVNKSPKPRFHHKTASLRHFTYYMSSARSQDRNNLERFNGGEGSLQIIVRIWWFSRDLLWGLLSPPGDEVARDPAARLLPQGSYNSIQAYPYLRRFALLHLWEDHTCQISSALSTTEHLTKAQAAPPSF